MNDLNKGLIIGMTMQNPLIIGGGGESGGIVAELGRTQIFTPTVTASFEIEALKGETILMAELHEFMNNMHRWLCGHGFDGADEFPTTTLYDLDGVTKSAPIRTGVDGSYRREERYRKQYGDNSFVRMTDNGKQFGVNLTYLYIDANNAMIATNSTTETLSWQLQTDTLCDVNKILIATSTFLPTTDQYVKRIYLGMKGYQVTNINTYGEGKFKPLYYYDVNDTIAAGVPLTTTITLGVN